MLILKPTQKNIIAEAVKVLRSGGLAIYPTETCYGAGVDATNQAAVNKLLAYKTRREGQPLSVAVADIKMATKYVQLNATARNLYQKFLPGPLTVVSRGRHRLAKGIESESGTLGIRISSYPLVKRIVSALGKPITATSANVSYKPRPYSIKQLLKYSSKKQQALIDLFIDAGTLPQRPVSTIVDTTLDDPLILRQGKIQLQGKETKLISHSPQETSQLAQTLCLKYWKTLQKKPLMFFLIGKLGSGKTQFAKGIGQFLQLQQTITSPSFVILKEYDYNRHQVKGKFLHLDTWRMQHLEELKQLDLAKQLKPKDIIAIEWADRAGKPLTQLAQKTKAEAIMVQISYRKDSSRKIFFHKLTTISS